MGKNLSSFMNPEFLEQYRIQAKKRYDRHKNLFLDKYGINIDLLNSYFPEFYNYIENRQFREAYRCLKAGEANFSTEEQKQIYDTFEKICFNICSVYQLIWGTELLGKLIYKPSSFATR